MKPLPRVDVIELFPRERTALIALLSPLDAARWETATALPGWSVKDIAAHIVGDDFGVISRQRDGYAASYFDGGWDELVEFINRQNDVWVRSMRRCSPRLLLELLEFSGERTLAHFRTRDLDALGPAVSWAGDEPAPAWLDVAREYTERWHHQQQIRDALCVPGLRERRFFAPVLETFVRALPRTFEDVDAKEGLHLQLTVTGDAGGAWSLVRADGRWQLAIDVEAPPDAGLTIDEDAAWRLMTRAMTPEEALPVASLAGDAALARRLLDVVAIIA